MTLLIRARDFEGAPRLETPLNGVLGELELRLQMLEANARTFLIGPVDLVTGASVAVGTPPFPLRIGLPQGVSLAGLAVVRAENLTAPGAIATDAHAVNNWRQEGNFLLVNLITGLSTNTAYRFVLGGFRA